MSPTLLALGICALAALAEGLLAGSGVRARMAQLRMPPYSPPFPLWLAIGGIYYLLCFVVLRHLLASRPLTLPLILALTLLGLILLANALWNVLFFRQRDLRASSLAFIPYALLVGILVALLIRIYPVGAALFGGYGLYLCYAAWWGYRLWRLNPTQRPVPAPHDSE